MRGTFDLWVEKGILQRGLIFGCPRCHYVDFYRLDEVGPGFACSRCRNVSRTIKQALWRDPLEEPKWYYDLDEVVYQMLENNGDVPLLALSTLTHGKASALFLPEAEVEVKGRRGERDIELDMWAVIDGDVAIGEAKSTDFLEETQTAEEDRCRRLAKVAAAVSADRFVLATSRTTWKSRTVEAMRTALPRGIQLQVLDGSQAGTTLH
jgi:hypothetical protein